MFIWRPSNISRSYSRTIRSVGSARLVSIETDGVPHLVFGTANDMRAGAEAMDRGDIPQVDRAAVEVIRSVEDVLDAARNTPRPLGQAVAEIELYDEIGLFGISARDFRAQLKGLAGIDFDLRVNSPGGDVLDAIAIFNAIADYSGTVTSYIDALAASAASFVPLAGGKVVAARHSQVMIHDAWGLSLGNAEDMRRAADFLDRQSDVIADIYADRARKRHPKSYWRDLMLEEKWFTDQEAVDYGLADEIGGKAKAKNTFDLSVFRNAPRNQVTTPDEPPAEPQDDQTELDMDALLAVAAAELEVAHADAH